MDGDAIDWDGKPEGRMGFKINQELYFGHVKKAAGYMNVKLREVHSENIHLGKY